jgi:fructuronate reductase
VLGAAGGDPANRVRAALAMEAVFGTDLPRDARFVAEVTDAFRLLLDRGARGAADSRAPA